jgi:hypothetical protein
VSSYNISIPEIGDPDPLTCQRRDTITWTNDSAETVISFDLPACVTPQNSPAPIEPGETTQEYTVRHDAAKKSYSYSYEFDDEDLEDADDVVPDTQNGTIDVS